MALLLALAMAMAQATESTTTNLCKRQWWANCSLFDMAGTPHGFRCPPIPTNIDENGQCGSISSWHVKHIKWILLFTTRLHANVAAAQIPNPNASYGSCDADADPDRPSIGSKPLGVAVDVTPTATDPSRA